MGQGYFSLLLARAMQGFASACISVCGMSIIAQVIQFQLFCFISKNREKDRKKK